MTLARWLSLAVLLLSGTVSAQSTGCPALPAHSGLSWQSRGNQEFLYCQAMRDADGSQAFAVMLRADPPFRPRRNNRAGETVIDGHAVHWYSSELPMEPHTLVRETLLELDRGLYAHIVVRAGSDTQLSQTQQLVEGVDFGGARLGSN